MIAHRLVTIKEADKILVFIPSAMNEGRGGKVKHCYFLLSLQVVEEGTHNELIAKKGIYYDFVAKQMMKKEEEVN